MVICFIYGCCQNWPW